MSSWILPFVAVVFAIIALLLILTFKPLRSFFALILNTIAGWIGLYIFNFIFAAAGFGIGINIVSASVVGVLGLPGLVMMILLKLVWLK